MYTDASTPDAGKQHVRWIGFHENPIRQADLSGVALIIFRLLLGGPDSLEHGEHKCGGESEQQNPRQ